MLAGRRWLGGKGVSQPHLKYAPNVKRRQHGKLELLIRTILSLGWRQVFLLVDPWVSAIGHIKAQPDRFDGRLLGPMAFLFSFLAQSFESRVARTWRILQISEVH